MVCLIPGGHIILTNGKLLKIFENHHTKRSQDLPELICPSGATWISQTATLNKENTFYSKGYYFCEMGWKEAIDIDDYEDYLLAKAAYMLNNGMVE